MGERPVARAIATRQRKQRTAYAQADTQADRSRKADTQGTQEDFMTIFVNGKQKRVRRPQLIEGLPVDEFIAQKTRTPFGCTRMKCGSS